jgi:hypothetical protein
MEEERGLFRADPFPVPRDDGGIDILFEELRWSEGRGTIGAVRYDSAGFGPVREVLRQPHHLSYPYTFQDHGNWLALPEQAGATTLVAYEASFGAKPGSPILEGLALLDASILYRNERYWLFATHPGATENAELHCYTASALGGPWEPHAGNPVKCDPRSARPAGHFFQLKGEWFRPAQDCTAYYGSRITVNRLSRLDLGEFIEEPVSFIEAPASWRYQDGLHTLSHCDDTTVLDGARLESVLHPALDGLARAIR